MDHEKRRVTVRRVWDSRADDIAFHLVYKPIANLQKPPSDGRVKTKWFRVARARWQAAITRWVDYGGLDKKLAARLGGCRVSGVTLSAKQTRHACRHAFCPYCRFRWALGLARASDDLFSRTSLDVAVWEMPVDEDVVLDERLGAEFRRGPVSHARQWMISTLRARGAHGVCCCSLWAVRQPDGLLTYAHRTVAVGFGIPDDLACRYGDELGSPGSLAVRRGLRPGSARSALRYCRDWLLVPIDASWFVGEWNRAFRRMSF